MSAATHKMPKDLTAGDRIATEHGPATVKMAYPGSPTGPWGEWFVIVLPDGYAATRTVRTGPYPGPIALITAPGEVTA